jgi:Domain of unknown function (DUF4440)
VGITAAGIIGIERERLHSLVDRNMSVADRLHAPEYQLVTPNGSTRTKSGYLGEVASRELEYLVFEPESDIAVQLSDDIVVLRYIARIVLSVGIDDEVELRVWHTDVYRNYSGQWMAIWSQATAISAGPTKEAQERVDR